MQHTRPSLNTPEGGCAADVCGLKYVSHTCKFIYFEVPKTGTSSLLNLLNEHAAISQMDGRYDFLDYPDYLRVAFVRNPWDRILSCYLNKIKKDRDFQNKHFEDGVMKKFHRFNVFYAGMPFVEFLHAVAEIPDEFADGHFASQYTRLVMEETLVITHLARFENYRAEVLRFLGEVGIDRSIELPHLNQTTRSRPYAEFYNDETIRLVQQRYSEDIRRFGYQFEGN